jgi:hypothetical protein
MPIFSKYAAVSLSLLFWSCKTPAPERFSEIHAAESAPLPCVGDRKFRDDGGRGFDFNAPRATMGSAYWMAIASNLAYEPIEKVEKAISSLGDGVVPADLKAFGEGDSLDPKKSADAYLADFPEGNILAFKGTNGVRDLLTDANITKNMEESYFSGEELGGLKIHKGFWQRADDRFSKVLYYYLKWQKNADKAKYTAGSEQAFEAISRTIRGITMKADPSTYDDTIGILIEYGMIVTTQYSQRDTILAAIADWKKVEVASAEARSNANNLTGKYRDIFTEAQKNETKVTMTASKAWILPK